MKSHDLNFHGKTYKISTLTLGILLTAMLAVYTVSCLGMLSVSEWLIPVWFILSFDFTKTLEDGTVKEYKVIKNDFIRSAISGAFISFGICMFVLNKVFLYV